MAVQNKDAHWLRQTLQRIDGRGYKAYKDIQGSYNIGPFTLFIDYVQGDPFAAPSRLRLRVPARVAGFPGELYSNKPRRIALEDYLTRAFARQIRAVTEGRRGSGKSGLVAIDAPGQEVLERTSMVVCPEYVEARFVVGLPAKGRRVLGRQAEEMLLGEIPRIGEAALLYENFPGDEMRRHVDLAEDQHHLRQQLRERNLVAFVADGAILPRESGVSDRPLPRKLAVPFRSPASLRVTIDLPHHGPITGMGVPAGITLIVGGGYHGKSTLLQAIERGVYDHIAGDGREYVITDPDAVKIRAEDGRRVASVDISPFINNLPFGQDTTDFSTDDASGSTSQASNIIEALEAGARVLLVDEDTSATNFMIRDFRMQQLVAKDNEPITPFVDKVHQLYRDLGVSTILVMGGSGDYFEVADTVIMMQEYLPVDVTEKAHQIAEEHQTGRLREGGERFGTVRPRRPLPQGIDPTKGRRRRVKIKSRGVDEIQFGVQDIDLQYVEQIVDSSQTNAIGDMIYYAGRKYIDGRRSLSEILDLLEADLDKQGLAVISPFGDGYPGEYARPRRHEVAAALNRLRTLEVRL